MKRPVNSCYPPYWRVHGAPRMCPSASLDRYATCSGSAFWALSVRSGRLRQSTEILCTMPYLDFRELTFLHSGE